MLDHTTNPGEVAPSIDDPGSPQPDLLAAVARLAAMDPVARAANIGPAARALGIQRGDLRAALDEHLRQAAREALEARAGGDGAHASADQAQAAGAPLSPEERQAEVTRLAALSRLDYMQERDPAAQRLGMGVIALDKLVKAETARQRADREEAHRRQAPPQPGDVREPFGFFRREDGLFADTGSDAPPEWIAAPFEVLGESRDHTGGAWGLWLRWRDGDGTLHAWAMPAALAHSPPGKLEEQLVAQGLRVTAEPGPRSRLRAYLAEVKAGNRVRLAYRCGWHGPETAPSYLLADGTLLGQPAELVVLHNPPEDAAQRCGAAGTLEGWKRGVAALAVGNPMAAFCIAAAFAGPLLLPAGEHTGGGFHLFGGSKRGKTTAMQMGLSAWAPPFKVGGALRDWRNTANALEAVAEDAGDALLALDELHQANPMDVAAACYMLAEGAGKGRLRADASARRRRTWRCCILSTGEHDVASAVARAGQKLPAGAEVRLASIPIDAAGSAWPNLHGFRDVPALAAALHDAMAEHHGEAARAFVAALATQWQDDPAALRDAIAELRERLIQRLPAQADAQVRDVARRCALVAVAGELATRWGILPWAAGEAEAAAAAMLAAWMLRRPGGAGSAEAAAMLEQVRRVLLAHEAARFTTLVKDNEGRWYELAPERPVVNRLGWIKREGERVEWLIAAEAWRGEVCGPAGLDPTATARCLAERGFLRRDGRHLTVNGSIPGHGKMRCYHIVPTLFDDQEAPT